MAVEPLAMCYAGLGGTLKGPANASIQNRLSRLLESFSFLPISDPTWRFRDALSDKRFFAACDPIRTNRARLALDAGDGVIR